MEYPEVQDFEASALGTKTYWDAVYNRENTNFKEIGDIGEIWFGEDSVERMVEWVTENVNDPNAAVIDLGCGNGHLLLELANEGYSNLTGIDYSEAAIDLAKSVADQRGLSNIHYEAVDFLQDDSWRQKTYNIVLDKGTFDAISLNPEQKAAKEQGKEGPRERYIEATRKMMDPQGLFLITSCNWTMEELIESFKHHFRYHSHVKYPTFSFGGQTGSKICTVAFEPLPL
ncbi:S-adenosyl-L-methionine-dependent methyltransferase [Radiomyces spectabilis]|uniref:S-adenosyl-L-methionine-dependent methyltransferase n=1 Tax=Radiomyces spectabilis TaxID=64574 RepID=UPI00222091C4|nr:S-adenosyl-L-methionine-dependent methyltransferase [Radiomyces spectabilis]KAI8377665.1 S-adenosyl-L-methionine-dependent methyltransferase [Radiomyces spectabilis]